ncbi:UNVERIFIED_CONTAM: hypothetical protein NY603_24785, partial [Bacteroidetes bacterium 56_B9]
MEEGEEEYDDEEEGSSVEDEGEHEGHVEEDAHNADLPDEGEGLNAHGGQHEDHDAVPAYDNNKGFEVGANGYAVSL